MTEAVDERGRGRPGPLLLLVPLLVAVLVALSWDDLFGGPAREPRPRTPTAGDVSAFTAEDVGGWARLRLVPLHPEPRRQAFEASVLRRSRGLEDGEPWRLLLTRDPSAEPGLVRAVEVRDGRGSALRPLSPAGASGGSASDPLDALLRPRRRPVEPGETHQVLLWGRRPRGTVLLSGLGSSGEMGSGAGPASSIPLEARALPRDELPRHLARLPAPDARGVRDDG